MQGAAEVTAGWKGTRYGIGKKTGRSLFQEEFDLAIREMNGGAAVPVSDYITALQKED